MALPGLRDVLFHCYFLKAHTYRSRHRPAFKGDAGTCELISVFIEFNTLVNKIFFFFIAYLDNFNLEA